MGRSRLRVLHLTGEFPPFVWGGLGTAVGGLATASARAGLAVGVLLAGRGYTCYGASVPAPGAGGDPAASGVEIFELDPGDRARAIAGAVERVRAWRPDVVHLHPVELWPIARAIREETGTPVVYTVHSLNLAEYQIGNEPPEILGLWRAQQELIAAADRLIVLTGDERDLLVGSCPAARDRVRIVGNGIDDSPAARAAATRERSSTAPIVLYSGRFVERKGVRELLAAIPRVLAAVPAARFVFVGGHGSGPDIERAWWTPGLDPHRDRIHFTGWLPSHGVADWYSAADVLAVPSWYEPFGMVILEGMLHGLPVAAADVGGPAEILDHGRTGLLFPPRDVDALADTLAALAASPELRRRLGAAAAAEVRRRWLWGNVVERVRSVYLEVRGRPGYSGSGSPRVSFPSGSTARPTTKASAVVATGTPSEP